MSGGFADGQQGRQLGRLGRTSARKPLCDGLQFLDLEFLSPHEQTRQRGGDLFLFDVNLPKDGDDLARLIVLSAQQALL